MISLKFVSEGPINNIPAFVQIMAWRQSRSPNESNSQHIPYPVLMDELWRICCNHSMIIMQSILSQILTIDPS